MPVGNATGFWRYFRYDITAGFLVFLIALPLCLGIAIASGFPPQAGFFTAIIGSFIAIFISNSEMTIKGPAAGLIVIVLGCVNSFGGGPDASPEAALAAYRATLAVGVAAAILQVLFGFFRGGIIGDFFPSAAVHGMLASIGIIIMLKQFPVALGVSAAGEPLEMIRELPNAIASANPAIACIGMVSLAIMFAWPLIGSKVRWLKRVPSQLIVLAVAIPMGLWLQLVDKHSYFLANHEYQLGDQYLVPISTQLFGLFYQYQTPDFTALYHLHAWKWVALFFIIGSLESMLSAKAVELIDPFKRRADMDKDLVSVGIGNGLASLVGGLPMISEIVRSRANVDNGARTRFSGFWHGLFLLICCSLIPMYLHLIPLAALASMLVYTGFRLAHPREFVHVYRVGREQLLIFVITLLGVLATDLLLGILIGIGAKMVFHLMNGVPLKSIFKPYLEVEQTAENQCTIHAHQSAIFSNWIPFRRQIEDLGLVQRQNITVDLSKTHMVDASVMEKLHEMQEVFANEGLELKVTGLEEHSSMATHAMATRKGGSLVPMKRLTILAGPDSAKRIDEICLQHDVASFVSQEGFGRTSFATLNRSGAGSPELHSKTSSKYYRIEVVCSLNTSDQIVTAIRNELPDDESATVYIEAIHLMRRPPASYNGMMN